MWLLPFRLSCARQSGDIIRRKDNTQAHNLKAARSNRAPATLLDDKVFGGERVRKFGSWSELVPVFLSPRSNSSRGHGWVRRHASALQSDNSASSHRGRRGEG